MVIIGIFFYKANGALIPLNNLEGISLLGDVVEAVASINPELYGRIGVHNRIHLLLARMPKRPSVKKSILIGISI